MFRSVSDFIYSSSAIILSALAPALWPVHFAWAQAPAGAPQPSPLMNMVPLLVVFAIMYFLMIRPQIRKQKEHQDFVSKLKRGDEVLTTSGIMGRIEGLTDLYVTLEIAPDVRVKIVRSQIASNVPNPAEVKS